VHPAWIDTNTLPIVAFDAFLEFADGDLVRISPCEVDLSPERYPALGLAVQPCNRDSLKFLPGQGQTVEAVELEETMPFMPFVITGIDESDPLGEDTINQYSLSGGSDRVITFRHIMPPMTLGIAVGLSVGT